jgi:hypothetical protein
MKVESYPNVGQVVRYLIHHKSFGVDNFINIWYQGIPPARCTRLWRDSMWHAPFIFVCREWRCDIHWFNILNRLGFCKKTTTPLEANLSKMPNWTFLNLGMPFTSFHIFHYLWLIFVGDFCVRVHSIKKHFMLEIKWLINFKSIILNKLWEQL